MARSRAHPHPEETILPEEQPKSLVIDLDEGFILFDDDSEALIDMMIDAFGCETEEFEHAVAIVARFSTGEDAGRFTIVDLRRETFSSMQVGIR